MPLKLFILIILRFHDIEILRNAIKQWNEKLTLDLNMKGNVVMLPVRWNILSHDRYSKFFHHDHNSLASSHRVRPKDREPTDQDTHKKRDYVHTHLRAGVVMDVEKRRVQKSLSMVSMLSYIIFLLTNKV